MNKEVTLIFTKDALDELVEIFFEADFDDGDYGKANAFLSQLEEELTQYVNMQLDNKDEPDYNPT